MNMKTERAKLMLQEAVRQYQHNDCSGLVFGYDRNITIRIVKMLMGDIRVLADALEELTPAIPPKVAPCHNHVVEQEDCAYCKRIIAAHKALKRVKNRRGR